MASAKPIRQISGEEPIRASRSRRQPYEAHSSARIASRGPSAWWRVPPHRQSFRRAGRSRARVATSRVGAQRRCVRGAHRIRALQVAPLTSFDSIARSAGCRDRGVRTRSRWSPSFGAGWIGASALVAPGPDSLAGRHRRSSVFRCPCGRSDTRAPWLKVDRSEFREGSCQP